MQRIAVRNQMRNGEQYCAVERAARLTTERNDVQRSWLSKTGYPLFTFGFGWLYAP